MTKRPPWQVATDDHVELVLLAFGSCVAVGFMTGCRAMLYFAKKDSGVRSLMKMRTTWWTLPILAAGLVGCSSVVSSRGPEAGEDAFEQTRIVSCVLGAGDTLEIKAWRFPELDQALTVDPGGQVSIFPVGTVQASGLTPDELRKEVTERLGHYYKNPVVSINITAYRSQKIMVLGEVQRPGVYPQDHPMSVPEALSSAGGLTSRGNSRSIVVIRGTGTPSPSKVSLFNLGRVLEGKETPFAAPLQRGDIVYVPSTFIARVEDVFDHLSKIINPLVEVERGIVLYPAAEAAIDNDRQRQIIISP